MQRDSTTFIFLFPTAPVARCSSSQHGGYKHPFKGHDNCTIRVPNY